MTTGHLYGYARVSTTDQDLSIQDATLRAAGRVMTRAEKMTGTSREGRTELAILLDFLREGDTLMVMRVYRLARSIGDLQDKAASVTSLKPAAAPFRLGCSLP